MQSNGTRQIVKYVYVIDIYPAEHIVADFSSYETTEWALEKLTDFQGGQVTGC